MRTGLVAVGVGFLVLAAGALITVNLLPHGTQVEDGFSVATSSVGPHGTGTALVEGTNITSGMLSLSWTATGALNISLSPASNCVSAGAGCTPGPRLFSWTGTGPGSWSSSGAFSFPYLIVWTSESNSSGTFSASGVETWTTSTAMTLLSLLFVDGVALALGGVGAVAAFLGFFLRTGVYRGPAPVASQSADDVIDLVGPPRSPP